MGNLLPTGAFDSVADDAVWGSSQAPGYDPFHDSQPETAKDFVDTSCVYKDVDVDIGIDEVSFPDVPVDDSALATNTMGAFRDIDVDVSADDKVNAFKEIDVDVEIDDDSFDAPIGTTTPSELIAMTSPKQPMQSDPSHTHKQLFLLGSTFRSNKTTVDYVAVNLAHILEMNPRASAKLARKLKRNQDIGGVSLGMMPVEKCKDIEAQLNSRDIDCRSVSAVIIKKATGGKPPAAKKKKSAKSMTLKPTVAFDEASSESPSVASSTHPLPPDTYVETQSHQGSHTSQKSTPRIQNLKKAFNGKLSSAASLSSHQRKPNFLSGSHKRSESNTSSIKSGDMIKARTSSAHAKSLEKNKRKVPPSSSSFSSSPSRAKVANRRAQAASTHQSLVFSSGVYEGEKRHGKPHGKGTFAMPGQFSYTGDWAMGNPSGAGFFKLANGEIREGSWDGTNFIEHRRFMAQSPKPKAISIPKKNEEYIQRTCKQGQQVCRYCPSDVVIIHRIYLTLTFGIRGVVTSSIRSTQEGIKSIGHQHFPVRMRSVPSQAQGHC